MNDSARHKLLAAREVLIVGGLIAIGLAIDVLFFAPPWWMR